MAKLVEIPKVEVVTQFTVTEGELRALDALAGYGDDAFIKMFYEKCGQHYLKPYEKDLRQFLTSVRSLAAPILSRTGDARKAFNREK